MIKNKEYQDSDYFISIGYTRTIENFEDGYDDPSVPKMKYMGLTIKSTKPGFDTPEVPDAPNFLRSKFDDVIEDFGEENKAFNQRNAEEIFLFLQHIPMDSTIHIHCQAGQSRSTGVGEGLKTIFTELGYEVDIYHVNSYIVPNKTVVKILLENKEILVNSMK